MDRLRLKGLLSGQLIRFGDDSALRLHTHLLLIGRGGCGSERDAKPAAATAADGCNADCSDEFRPRARLAGRMR